MTLILLLKKLKSMDGQAPNVMEESEMDLVNELVDRGTGWKEIEGSLLGWGLSRHSSCIPGLYCHLPKHFLTILPAWACKHGMDSCLCWVCPLTEWLDTSQASFGMHEILIMVIPKWWKKGKHGSSSAWSSQAFEQSSYGLESQWAGHISLTLVNSTQSSQGQWDP